MPLSHLPFVLWGSAVQFVGVSEGALGGERFDVGELCTPNPEASVARIPDTNPTPPQTQDRGRGLIKDSQCSQSLLWSALLLGHWGTREWDIGEEPRS